MDIKVFVLLVFVGVLGSFAEARSSFARYPRNGAVRRDASPIMGHLESRSKRAVGDSNGSGPNYGWPSASGAGFASAGAGSYAGSYPGTGPMTGYSPMGPTNVGNRGGSQDNAPDQTGYKPNNRIDPPYNAGPGFYFPGQYPPYNDPFNMFQQIQAQIEAQHQANMDFHNRLANEVANYGGGYGGSPQVASASAGIGPNGGFQTGYIHPAAPGVESRFAEDLPPPSGDSYGVFSGSVSTSMTGPDGKQINHKSATTGINDNGKVSFRTVHD